MSLGAATERQRGILDFIEKNMRERGYPPSVREIGEAVGLSSSATVHNHLAALQKMGYLHRDPTKPRAIEVRYEASSGVAMERRPTKHVPLVGDVADPASIGRRLARLLLGSLDPKLAFNDGMRDAIRLVLAPRTVTNAEPPAPKEQTGTASAAAGGGSAAGNPPVPPKRPQAQAASPPAR